MRPCILKLKEECPVLVVEPTASVRQMIVDVVKGLGYPNVQGVPTTKDALHYLEVEKVGWLITSLYQHEKCNAIHLLKIITQNPKLFGIATSLLIDPSAEDFCLPLAFELGLMSFHRKSYIKEDFSDEFEELVQLLQLSQWNATLCSAEFLRSYLTEKSQHKSRMALEQNLLSLFPGSARVLYYLAEAEFLIGEHEAGAATLEQVKVIDEKMTSHCKRLSAKYLGDEATIDTKGKPHNALGIKNVVVVDPDTDIHFHSKELLDAVGVANTETMEDGEDAFQWLSSSKEPDLILMEWRIPTLNGPILVQRIRQHGFLQVPIVVISSLIKPDDIHLLREMGVDECLDKPFDHNGFYSTIIWAIQQSKFPTEQKSLSIKIRRLLEAGKIDEAERLMSQLFSDERTSEGVKLEVRAEYYFSKGNYIKARNLGIEAMKHGGDSLLMLNLTGKSMLKLKQYEGALKAFEKANNISSLNVERLLNIAEASLYLDDTERAQEAIKSAEQLDSTNHAIDGIKCKVSIETGDTQTAKTLMRDLESGRNVISYMNNRAVSLARTGRFEDGISLYRKTIESLPDSWKEISASVYYNLGLAYARYGDLQTAIDTLSDIKGAAEGTLKKSKSLIRRLQDCIDRGVKLDLKDDDENSEISSDSMGDASESVEGTKEGDDSSFEELLADIEAKRGDIGCYLIFYAIEGHNDESIKLAENLPKFRERDAIGRDETFVTNRSGKAS